MPLPKFKLSPLQSRLAASLMASIALLMLYFVFSNPQFAYAADVSSMQPEDHNHNRLQSPPFLDMDIEDVDMGDVSGYQETMMGYGGGIIGRAAQAPTATDALVLVNNQRVIDNVVQGETKQYSFLKSSVFGDPSTITPKLPSPIGVREVQTEYADGEEGFEDGQVNASDAVDLKRRQSTEEFRVVYISVNTCEQPRPLQNTTVEPPPQLKLYISQSQNNTNPGPSKPPDSQEVHVLEGGATMVKLNATGDIFIGLSGEATTAYKDVWNAQIAVSIDGFYHTFHNGTDSNLIVVDTDSSSSLLVTNSLTSENKSSAVYEAWMKARPPFVLFANKKGDDQIVNGLQNSYCGLATNAGIRPLNGTTESKYVEQSITNMKWNLADRPRQRFYLSGLLPNSSYNLYLGVLGNTTDTGNFAGGGGQVWPMQTIQTLTNGNCAILYGLSFCENTAYAVPANPLSFPNISNLAAYYDNNTKSQFDVFKKVLAQIPCETTSSAQYSLARTCDDCSNAYKEWVCAVSIPRCTDWSPAAPSQPWLQQRNMVQPFPNSSILGDYNAYKAANDSMMSSIKNSRNLTIDQVVRPGPYNEILPCDDLCYHIVQSCPAIMGFMCPRPRQKSFNQSYAVTRERKCNFPGSQGFDSWGTRIEVYWMMLITMAVIGWIS